MNGIINAIDWRKCLIVWLVRQYPFFAAHNKKNIIFPADKKRTVNLKVTIEIIYFQTILKLWFLWQFLFVKIQTVSICLHNDNFLLLGIPLNSCEWVSVKNCLRLIFACKPDLFFIWKKFRMNASMKYTCSLLINLLWLAHYVRSAIPVRFNKKCAHYFRTAIPVRSNK